MPNTTASQTITGTGRLRKKATKTIAGLAYISQTDVVPKSFSGYTLTEDLNSLNLTISNAKATKLQLNEDRTVNRHRWVG